MKSKGDDDDDDDDDDDNDDDDDDDDDNGDDDTETHAKSRRHTFLPTVKPKLTSQPLVHDTTGSGALTPN